jgi:hypothetical protein
MGTGRARPDVARCQHVRQLSVALLTLMSAPAAGLGVGWRVLTGCGSGGGDRPKPLQSRTAWRANEVLLQPGCGNHYQSH